MKHTWKLLAALALALCILAGLVACGGNQTETETAGETAPQSDYTVKLTAIGSTTIKTSKTLQLRSSVTGTTQKDVTFTSDNPSVATVSDKGLVTGIGEGTATITCTLVIDPNAKATILVTVEKAATPTSLSITGTDSDVQWAGETLQLSATVLPEDASGLCEWATSDPSVATVSETGLVTFLRDGTVTITCTSTEDRSIHDAKTFTVKKGVFRSDLGSPYWDITDQSADADPCVRLEIDEGKAGYHSLYFADVSATRYYVEGYFTLDRMVSGWVWQGFGFGSGLSETSTRYFIFSPRVDGQGNDFNKFIVKDLPNESWPAITMRSQTWGENGLNAVDWKNAPVKISLLRDNNVYYYSINDRLMYVDVSTVYDGIPTMPILVAIDECVTVTDYRVVTDDAELDALLTGEQYRDSFYASNSDIVDYMGDDRFVFRSGNILSKDNKVKSLGDKAMLVGDFTVEFDVSDILCNSAHTSSATGITLNLSRYDSADTVETFMVGTSAEQDTGGFVARYLSWNYPLSMEDPNAPYYWMESSQPVFENPQETHHIKITRTIENNLSTFRMFVDGQEISFDVSSSKWQDMTSKYTGAYIIWVAGEYASGLVTNFTYSSDIK